MIYLLVGAYLNASNRHELLKLLLGYELNKYKYHLRNEIALISK